MPCIFLRSTRSQPSGFSLLRSPRPSQPTPREISTVRTISHEILNNSNVSLNLLYYYFTASRWLTLRLTSSFGRGATQLRENLCQLQIPVRLTRIPSRLRVRVHSGQRTIFIHRDSAIRCPILLSGRWR